MTYYPIKKCLYANSLYLIVQKLKSANIIYRDYRSPFTRLGVSFSEPELGEVVSFIVHECGYRKYENWNHCGICSPYWRLHYNSEPGSAIRCGENIIPLDPDNLLITPAEIFFDTMATRAVPHLWIHFTPDNDFAISLQKPLRIMMTSILKACAEACIEAYDTDCGLDQRNRLHHLCKGLLHHVFAVLPSEFFNVYPERIHRVLEHIARHTGGDLSRMELARKAGMGLRSFEYEFKQYMCQSPAAYVSVERMREACRMLSLSSTSIDQIAETLGYPNRYYFSRVFKKHLGCGPAAFRKGGAQLQTHRKSIVAG